MLVPGLFTAHTSLQRDRLLGMMYVYYCSQPFPCTVPHKDIPASCSSRIPIGNVSEISLGVYAPDVFYP